MRTLLLAALLSAAFAWTPLGPVPLLAQDVSGSEVGRPRPNQLSIDIGPLEGGLTYVHRLGRGPFSLGGGMWVAWEPQSTFEQEILNVRGAEVIVRLQAHKAVQFELGPSVLKYDYADDCSECTGTFFGLRAAAMVGHGAFWVGPTARLGVLPDSPQDFESGALLGLQGRLLFSWGK
jgi:hypothetical protein